MQFSPPKALRFSVWPTALLGLSLAALVAAPAQADANLVTNPGFETGDFSGYSLSGNSYGIFISSLGAFTHSGQYGVQAGPAGSDGFLTQNLNTVAGQSYNISFFLYNNDQGTNDLSVSFGGIKVLSQTNIPASSFQQYTATGFANGSSTPLVMGFRNDPGFFGLDDISVTQESPVPEASTTASFGVLVALGLGGAVFAAKKRKAA